MNLRDLFFRRRPPVNNLGTLADFIDEQSAFVTQKGIYEYSRARAAHYAKVLFREQEFLDAVERSRWGAYPLGLAMVAEIVEGVLRQHAGAASQQPQRERLNTVVLSVFDRYPVPEALGVDAWSQARAQLVQNLQRIGLHPTKRAKDVPEPFARAYFDFMPIHKQLRGRDFSTTHNYLRVTMCNIHDELSTRMDPAALVQALLDEPVTTS